MNRLFSFKICLFYLFVNLIIHLPFLSYSPSGAHVWRQCNTLAMSRNFAEESMNIMKPRIDRRNESNGITGSHFPLYEWGLACISKVLAFNDVLPRIYSAVIFTFGMLAIYFLCVNIGIPRYLASFAGVLMLSLPQLYYDSINAMPDILAMTLSLYALNLLIKSFHKKPILYFSLGLLFTLISGLIKPQFLIIPFTSIAFTRYEKISVLKCFLLLSVLLPVYAWYCYAIQLTSLNNLKEYGLWIKPIPFSEKLSTINGNILSDMPELLFGWPFLIAFIWAAFKFNKFNMPGQIGKMSLLWSFGFIVFYALAIERMKHHSYYFISVLPLFVLLFIYWIRDWRFAKVLLLIICFLNVVWASVRIIPSRWVESKRNIPIEFVDKEMRSELEHAIPKGERCVIGPDISGCIYFYFTKTKGYSFENAEELNRPTSYGTYLNEIKAHGVKYLIHHRKKNSIPIIQEIKGKTLLKQIGEFEIWALD